MTKIDLSYLESIAAGDKAFVKQMLELFISSTVPEIDELEKNYLKKDWQLLGIMAHKIKGPLQMMGQNETCEQLLAIEKIAKSKTNTEKIAPLLLLVKNKMNEIDAQVKKMLGEMQSNA